MIKYLSAYPCVIDYVLKFLKTIGEDSNIVFTKYTKTAQCYLILACLCIKYPIKCVIENGYISIYNNGAASQHYEHSPIVSKHIVNIEEVVKQSIVYCNENPF